VSASRLRTYRPALLLAAAALLLRIAVLLWRSQHDPLFHEPLNDAAYYDAWAKALAAGLGHGPAGAPYYMPPLYPHLLDLLQRIGGVWGPTIFQMLCGACTVIGIQDLGRHLYGDRAGLWAGLLALYFAPPLWFEGWLLPTTLNLFLLVVILDLAVACRQRGDDRRLLPWLGLLLGLAIINRPQHLLLLAGLLAWRGWTARRRPVEAVVPLLLIVLGVVIVIAPVTLRNIRVSGEAVPVSVNGGINFYLGNQQGATGRFDLPPDLPSDIASQQEASLQRARAGAGRSLDWRGASSYWFKRGIGALTADPAGTLRLYARKLRLIFAWREMEHNFLASWVHRHTGPGHWLIPSLGLLWLLAIPGLAAALRERRGEVGPLLLLTGTTVLTCLLFWVNTRHRLPLMIPLSVFAGAALASPKTWLSKAAVAAVLIAALVVFWPTGDHEGASFHASLGRVHAQRGAFTEARGAYEDALVLQPGHPQARNGIALTYMEEGDVATAERLLRELLDDHPDYGIARRNLELILRSRSQP
jgi:tetratricopeptide (TPR) repeat protein